MCANHLPEQLVHAVSQAFTFSVGIHTTVSVTKGVGVQPRGGIRLGALFEYERMDEWERRAADLKRRAEFIVITQAGSRIGEIQLAVR